MARIEASTARVAAAAAVVGTMALLAAATGAPLVFPSLGPSACTLLLTPEAPAASPRRVLVGHGVALVWGQIALVVTGLAGAPAALVVGVDLARAAAVTLALAGSTWTAERLDARHPPAGATTLLVALGLLQGPRDLAAMAAAIAGFTGLAVAVDRGLRRLAS